MTIRLLAIVLGGAVLCAAVAPFLVPETARVQRDRVIDADASAVFAVLSSNAGYQTINPFKTADPDLSIELFGPEQGVGSGFRFSGKGGSGTQTVASVQADRSVRYAIDMGFLGQPEQEIRLEPMGEKTRVTWTMQASAGPNPVRRLFNLGMPRMMGPTLEHGLDNLATTL